MASSNPLPIPLRLASVTGILLALFACTANAQSAYVRVSQVGYEACEATRAPKPR
jgi:hypothetical protein